MSYDGIVWECLNHSFCSFKIKTPRQMFCTNKYNLTGLCSKRNCPLANSRYATVLDVGGHIVLHMKVIERTHLPSEQWERIELPQDYKQAVKELRRHLQFWPGHIRAKCRLRLKAIKEMHARMKKLEKAVGTRVVVVKKKAERRDRIREAKALAAAQIEKTIQKELLTQLAEGKYEGIYNFAPSAYRNVVLASGARLHDLEDALSHDEHETEAALEEPARQTN